MSGDSILKGIPPKARTYLAATIGRSGVASLVQSLRDRTLTRADLALVLLRSGNEDFRPIAERMLGLTIKRLPYGPLEYKRKVKTSKKAPVEPRILQKVLWNPCKQNSKSWHYFHLMKRGMTLEQVKTRGVTRRFWNRAIKRGWIIVGKPRGTRSKQHPPAQRGSRR